MTYILCPKDSELKLTLHDVDYHWEQAGSYCFLLADGTIRKYPLIHLWYIEKLR